MRNRRVSREHAAEHLSRLQIDDIEPDMIAEADIADALAAYWMYQGWGNQSPAEWARDQRSNLLLTHMKASGVRKVTPTLRSEDHNMPLLPWIDAENFNPGYMVRGMHLLPKRGDKPEWQHTQDYWAEKDEFPAIDLNDAAFVYA